MKNYLPLIAARILFAIPFLAFGAMHLMGADQMAGMVPSWLPGGVLWIYITGLAQIAGGLAIILDKMMPLASNLLALLMLVYVILIQYPMLANEVTRQIGMAGVLKDLGLAGGALLAGYLSGSGNKEA
jgi:putative oxidoreductase